MAVAAPVGAAMEAAVRGKAVVATVVVARVAVVWEAVA